MLLHGYWPHARGMHAKATLTSFVAQLSSKKTQTAAEGNNASCYLKTLLTSSLHVISQTILMAGKMVHPAAAMVHHAAGKESVRTDLLRSAL